VLFLIFLFFIYTSSVDLVVQIELWLSFFKVHNQLHFYCSSCIIGLVLYCTVSLPCGYKVTSLYRCLSLCFVSLWVMLVLVYLFCGVVEKWVRSDLGQNEISAWLYSHKNQVETEFVI
jgi:hypothetical protein